MGASTFLCEGRGDTAQKAFEAARRDALYRYGHGGYTGSLAEKQSFTLIRDNPTDVAKRLRAYDRLTREYREAAARDLETLSSPDVAAQNLAHALLLVDDPRVDSKYGPAGCVEIEKGRYLFFGWAAE